MYLIYLSKKSVLYSNFLNLSKYNIGFVLFYRYQHILKNKDNDIVTSWYIYLLMIEYNWYWGGGDHTCEFHVNHIPQFPNWLMIQYHIMWFLLRCLQHNIFPVYCSSFPHRGGISISISIIIFTQKYEICGKHYQYHVSWL